MDIMDINKKYYVVEFPEEENEGNLPMSVIPENWLQRKDLCTWPNNLNQKAFTEAVKCMKDISSLDYILCKVHIKYGSNSLEKANEKLRILEETEKGNDTVNTEVSSDEASTSLNETKQSTKRNNYKTKKLKDYELNFSSGDEEDQLPSIPKNNLKFNQKLTRKPMSEGFLPKKQINEQTLNKSYLTNAKTSEQSSETSASLENVGREEPEEVAPFNTLYKKMVTIEGVINKMYKKIWQITFKMGEISEKLGQIQTTSTLHQQQIYDSNLLKDFPAAMEQDLQQLDSALMSEDAFLEIYGTLKRIGGRHALEGIRNMLGSLISHSLALKMNWSGRNEKSAFKKFKNLVKVILAVARDCPKGGEMTQTEVENIIKLWLRSAGDRVGGREKRRSLSSPPALKT